MCYEFEWFYELQRAEQERRDRQKTEEANHKPEPPGKPAQAPNPGEREPIPA